MGGPIFADRREAGRELGLRLLAEAGPARYLVLGLPRGGVPVAYEVAAALGAPLDVMLVRKLGVPRQPELAFGAIASGGVVVLNRMVVADVGLGPDQVERVAQRERTELEQRERTYRGGRSGLELSGRRVVLVDDGLATGATMRAAVLAARERGAAVVIAAAPVGSREACAAVRREADQVVALTEPSPFQAVSLWYRDFGETGDAEVCALLGGGPR